MDQASVCYLTTTGRRTGRPHRIEIWFAAPGGSRIYMLAGGRDRADWVRNVQADGAVEVEIAGTVHHGRAQTIEGEPDDPLARRLLDGKYHGWREGQPLTEWARTALPVAVDLD